MIFNGFEQILMCVIKNTCHFDDLHKGSNISNQKRFDDAMKALFGSHFENRHVRVPADVTSDQIQQIRHLNEDKEFPLESAIKEVMERELRAPKNDAEKREYDAELSLIVDRIKKHLSRRSGHYKSFIPADSDNDIENSPYYDKEEKATLLKDRKAIERALRKADWPI